MSQQSLDDDKKYGLGISSDLYPCSIFTKSDDLTEIMFQSLRPSYDFLKQCKAVLEVVLRTKFPRFILWMRGSVASETALASTVDLDADLIFPYDLSNPPASNSEPDLFIKWVKKVKNTIISTRSNVELSPDPNARPETSKESFIKIRTNARGETLPSSRGIPLLLVLNGIEIELDLFPKFVDSDGKVCSLLSSFQGSYRWHRCDWNLFKSMQSNFNEEEEAALLFIKLWKHDFLQELQKKVNDFQRSGNPRFETYLFYLESLKNLKSYHFAHILKDCNTNNNNNHDDNNNNDYDQNKRTRLNCEIPFSRLRVANLIVTTFTKLIDVLKLTPKSDSLFYIKDNDQREYLESFLKYHVEKAKRNFNF